VKSITQSFLINYPQTPDGTVSFNFSADCSLGNFQFSFKWLDGMGNGWATLPSGEVRQFGCVPGVYDWTEFPDYGIVLGSPLPVLGLTDLVGNSTLYLIDWGVD